MDDRCQARLCVLSSGSSGNCSVLQCTSRGRRRTILIDAGLSPRRTGRLLEQIDMALTDVDDVLLTHLDSDHWHRGWATGWTRVMRPDARLHMHRAHARRAERVGTLFARPTPFAEDIDLDQGVRASSMLLSHDQEGVAAFRFETEDGALGWVTDAGRVTDDLIDRMRGVEVLAIESNYCPRLQASSGRPAFLIQRVTGGAGHLSNEECLRAVERIGPREHVVLLHLSRDCNHPDLVAAMHAGSDYAITIAPRHQPTRWIKLTSHARLHVRGVGPGVLS